MGVDRSDYIIYGWKLPADFLKPVHPYDEQYLQYVEGRPGESFSMVYDGMSGEYLAFGYLIAHSDEYNGFDFHEIDVSQLPHPDQIKSKFVEVFGKHPESDPKVLVFTHWH